MKVSTEQIEVRKEQIETPKEQVGDENERIEVSKLPNRQCELINKSSFI